MTDITRPIMRYHGGKYRLAPWIISHFPTHKVYVEPFGGAGSVLLRKPRSHGEVYNDLDDEIVNVMRVLRNPELCAQLEHVLVLTPYSRAEFDLAFETVEDGDPVERARRALVRAEMGFGSAGATKGTTGFRIDTQRNYGTAMQVWARVPEGLARFCERLQGVLIENRPALSVLADHDTPHTLFYVDPPYVHDTRQMGSRCYRHEMDDAEHETLLRAILGLQGMVVLSGYPCDLYEDLLGDWRRVETSSRMAAGRGTGLRTEVLWLSPSVADWLDGGMLDLAREAV